MSELLAVKGTVVNVNHKLLTFQVRKPQQKKERPLLKNKDVTVHMVLLCIKNAQQKLPGLNTNVVLHSPDFECDEFGRTFVLLSSLEQIVEGTFNIVPESNGLINIVKELDLTVEKLLPFAKNYKNLNIYFKSEFISSEDVMMSTLDILRYTNFELQFLNHLKFIDDNPLTYKEYSYWTFGTHWNWSNTDEKPHYLFGYISTDNIHFYFLNNKRIIPCVFINSTNVFEFLNCYVLIKDYIIITEIYNSVKYYATEYLLVDPKNVVNLKLKAMVAHAQPPPTLDKKVVCEIVSKSQMMILRKDAGCWFQVKTAGNKCCWIFAKNPKQLFQPGYSYDVFYKNMKAIRHKEVEVLLCSSQRSMVLYELEEPQFIKTGACSSQEILDVPGAIKNLQASPRLISFEGVISLKLFVNPLSSRTSAITNDDRFGTPGDKTQKLVFEADGKKLEVYLNNWENLAKPWGLIPSMRVIIRNVLSQKSKYYKSTMLTGIEVLQYVPKVPFNTANLFSDDWGFPFYLGLGKSIPTSVVIWARISCFKIRSLKFQENTSHKMEGHISLSISDNFGKSTVIAKQSSALLLLRLMLQVEKPTFDQWLQEFVSMRTFSYCEERANPETDEGILQLQLAILEKTGCQMKLLCRKMDNDGHGDPVYFVLDGRF